RKECGDEAGRTVYRHLDRLALQLFGPGAPPRERTFAAPKGVYRVDMGQDREVPGWRRRGRRPLQRAAVPWISGRITELLAVSDRDDELNDLANDSCQNDHSADFGEQ